MKDLNKNVGLYILYYLFIITLSYVYADLIKFVMIRFISLFLRREYIRIVFTDFPEATKKMKDENPTVLILYPTCDDFIPYCALCALSQTYQNKKLLICDDSKTDYYKNIVDK
jgi:hypothetical protein